MASAQSPLRYPGGKQILGNVLAELIRLNRASGGTYIEAYAGGAGAALSLLFAEHVSRIVINDKDPAIFAFWNGVLHRTERFVKLLRETPTTVDEWQAQREVYLKPRGHSALRLGFATFFLNRCNRSGVIANGGIIGGKQQTGKWKIDARFNREELEARIRRISLYRERIDLHSMDAIDFLRDVIEPMPTREKPFVYLDPPYYAKGSGLYLNHYQPDDHGAVATYLRGAPFRWVLTYDNVAQIRALYADFRQVPFSLNYSAREASVGSEVMVVKDGLTLPATWKKRIPHEMISAAYRAVA
jgi:DNA adenine methylase